MEKEIAVALTLLALSLAFLARNIWEMDRLVHLAQLVKEELEKLRIIYFNVANLNDVVVHQVRNREGKIIEGDEYPAWRTPRRGTYGGETF